MTLQMLKQRGEMEWMQASCTIAFLLHSLLVGSGEAFSSEVIFCVKLTANTTCGSDHQCQLCETLDYYFNNVDSVINRQKNATIIFMAGYHNSSIGTLSAITVPIISLIGEKTMTVTIECPGIDFLNNSKVSIQNLALNKTRVHTLVSTMAVSKPLMLQLTSVKLQNCTEFQLRPSHEEIFIDSTFIEVVFNMCTLENNNVLTLKGAKASLIDCSILNSPVDAYSSEITISGETEIKYSEPNKSAIASYSSNVTLLGSVSFVNNSGIRGGAMALYSSTLFITAGADVLFANNTVIDKGGAIYTDATIEPYSINSPYWLSSVFSCFYQLLSCTSTTHVQYNLRFANNFAPNGGDDIYGGRITSELCHSTESFESCNLTISQLHKSGRGLSSITSEPTRVCLCDDKGEPQCLNDSYSSENRTVYPGESFSVPLAIVGEEFGTTLGTIHANFLSNAYALLHPISQYGQVINNLLCNDLNYTVYSKLTDREETMYITPIHMDIREVIMYKEVGCNTQACLYYTPIFIYITILPCPSGFNLIGEPPRCDCCQVLTDHHIECEIVNGTGYFLWSGNVWINITKQGDSYVNRCPFDYCKISSKKIDVKHLNSQCAFNRTGRLCGGCKENYSLAIGSSHCIHCPNNNHLALLIFFAAAGFLLVFFISAFNLTVSQGMINGLIFYANVVWVNDNIMLPLSDINIFLRVFLAWLNLDFGIECCFFTGLDAFSKTWLQYVFPIYTAGLFIAGVKYSSKLSKLFGDRSVPVLATLLFLSYTKLLHTIITSLELAPLISMPNGLREYVWYVDGNLNYGKHPHIFLLIAALFCLFLFWLPYTILLLVMQWLRRFPDLTVSRWITRYKPFFDAYYAPLKDQHQYWFGVLLLIRGILLLISSLTVNLNPTVSLFLHLGAAPLLLWYMNYRRVYKQKCVLILESCFLVNLIILVGGMTYMDTAEQKVTLTTISVVCAFVKFCGIVVWNVFQSLVSICRQEHIQAESNNTGTRRQPEHQITYTECTVEAKDDQFRDSILENTPLLTDKSTEY